MVSLSAHAEVEALAQTNLLSFLQDQIVQLVNTIFSRKNFDSLSEAFSVALAASALSTNRYHLPLIVVPDGPAAVSHKQPLLKVCITRKRSHIQLYYMVLCNLTPILVSLSAAGYKCSLSAID